MTSSLDYDIYLKAFLRLPETSFLNVPESLGLYRRHEKQITTARREEQLHYAFKAQMQIFQALGIAPTNKLMVAHKIFFRQLRVETAEEMADVMDWAVTLRMANAAKRIFVPEDFDAVLFQRLVAVMQSNPALAECHWHRLSAWKNEF